MARRIGWIFMALAVLAFAVGNTRFFVDPDFSTALDPQVFIDNAMLVRIHILAGTFSILTGPFPFWAGFRNRHRNWHRLMGRIYLGGAVVGVASALYIAWISFGGFPAHIWFFCVGSWLGWDHRNGLPPHPRRKLEIPAGMDDPLLFPGLGDYRHPVLVRDFSGHGSEKRARVRRRRLDRLGQYFACRRALHGLVPQPPSIGGGGRISGLTRLLARGPDAGANSQAKGNPQTRVISGDANDRADDDTDTNPYAGFFGVHSCSLTGFPAGIRASRNPGDEPSPDCPGGIATSLMAGTARMKGPIPAAGI